MISASEILAKIERGEPVEYADVIVVGDLDVSVLHLPIERIKRKKGTIDDRFMEYVLKSIGEFIDVGGGQHWSDIEYGISEELRIIDSAINIIGSEVRGSVNFSDSLFMKTINFMKTQFSGHVDFRGSKVSGGDANFVFAKFTGGNTNFAGAEFAGGHADFGGAEFTGGYAYFWRTKFSGGKANFQFAKFGGYLNFAGADFGYEANFLSTKFGLYTTFSDSKFSGEANFSAAKFGGQVDFKKTTFNNDTTFNGAEFHKILRLDEAKFERLFVSWDSIKNALIYDGLTYLALIKKFRDIEQFEDADNCYYQFRRQSQARKKWLRENRFNWSKLLDWIGFVSCGYGVRIQPIILWVLGSVLGFALLYKLLPQSRGGIAESGPSTVTMEAVNNSTLLFTFGSGDGVISPSWGECLYFSFTALTGGTPDGLHPVGLCKYAVMIEGVLGYLFLALFVVVLARKIIR